jgi:hypothetical protein
MPHAARVTRLKDWLFYMFSELIHVVTKPQELKKLKMFHYVK